MKCCMLEFHTPAVIVSLGLAIHYAKRNSTALQTTALENPSVKATVFLFSFILLSCALQLVERALTLGLFDRLVHSNSI